jgi:hypothetical protein
MNQESDDTAGDDVKKRDGSEFKMITTSHVLPLFIAAKLTLRRPC